uniref:Exonuclease VII large subunit n=1 Tax=Megaviridae environmental sample TaxID=1737588 RepID=A0A5J6VI56_9VIRU|nr:MAG: exonuclease VII large subunit [Megaviridae environmental sample]
MQPLTITKLNQLISRKIKSNIIVIGQVTDIKPSLQHLYFSLKDETSSINVIIWASNRTHIIPSNGQMLKVSGYLDYYVKGGRLTLIIKDYTVIEETITRYNRLKLKYQNKKYFDGKQTSPNNIRECTIITSSEGAALQDILHVLSQGSYPGTIWIRNANVQGKNCVSSVIKQLEEFLTSRCKTCLLTRGGGSAEDLEGFNDPEIIEMVFKCRMAGKFIMSAIGHQVDNVLTDLVSDVCLSTPTYAGDFLIKNTISFQNRLKSFALHCSAELIKKVTARLQYLSQTKDIISIPTKINNIRQNIKSRIDSKIQQLDWYKKTLLQLISTYSKWHVTHSNSDLPTSLDDITTTPIPIKVSCQGKTIECIIVKKT